MPSLSNAQSRRVDGVMHCQRPRPGTLWRRTATWRVRLCRPLVIFFFTSSSVPARSAPCMLISRTYLASCATAASCMFAAAAAAAVAAVVVVAAATVVAAACVHCFVGLFRFAICWVGGDHILIRFPCRTVLGVARRFPLLARQHSLTLQSGISTSWDTKGVNTNKSHLRRRRRR